MQEQIDHCVILPFGGSRKGQNSPGQVRGDDIPNTWLETTQMCPHGSVDERTAVHPNHGRGPSKKSKRTDMVELQMHFAK